ncbi:hypothetical protein B0H14DRAFT_2584468 [Mycena olivaceomarginata]|nr:hypothetical protein B0H14DRAFT_2584468 [Mycena olivaceomarginata]
MGTYTDIFVATADNEAGAVNMAYPDLDDLELTVEKCEIAKELMGKGMSQAFFTKNHALSRSSSILVMEGIRLPCWKTGRPFAKRWTACIKWVGFWPVFMSVPRRARIDIDEDISVTQCQLIVEVAKQGEAPSKASGYSLSEVEITECPMVWLIEPF